MSEHRQRAGGMMSQAILIASYYRSGTSALSGALSLAGVDIVNTDERNEHNPRGYFENPVLARLNLDVFQRLDRDWHDVRLMPPQWQQRPDMAVDTQRIVAEMRARHSGSPLWAVKHPHLCRLLPLYEEAAERVSDAPPSIIHIYRDPWVVAHSQYKKNGLSRAHALLLWTSYILDAERYARGLSSVVLDYELLVKDTRKALHRIASSLGVDYPRRTPRDLANIHRFLTPQLRRSRPQERDSTPTIVRRLVEDVWEAALSEAGPAHFDRLRERFQDQCAVFDELAASQLAVTATLQAGRQKRNTPPAAKPSDSEGSPLRPAERTDIAERRRLAQRLQRAASLATLTIVVAVPAGRVEAAFETAGSIEHQWHAPNAVHYLCSDDDIPPREGWLRVDSAPGALTQALADHINHLDTDYVTVVDAGDRIEPDACARLCLFAADKDLPALIYTDEIVANAKDPWIRHKPDFDIERLRSLHYLGGWLWYSTNFLRREASFDGSLAGAEDLDIALRAYEADKDVAHLPEGLYARAPDSRRDTLPAEAVRTHARKALGAHLNRCGIEHNTRVDEGRLPGSFAIRHEPAPGKRISLVLLCNEAPGSQTPELEPQRLGGTLAALSIDHLVCAATDEGLDSEIRTALERLAGENPAPDQLHVVRAANEARMLAQIQQAVGEDAVIFLALNASTADAHWLAHLQGKLFEDNRRVGMIGARADHPAGGGEHNLLGPLLLGAGEGAGIVGVGRDAADPGPGGWLLSAQSVDGVAPPCLALRGTLFKQLTIDEQLLGAPLWLDLSMQIWQRGYQVIWDPSVRVSCSNVPAYAVQTGPQTLEAGRRLRSRWGCRSPRHHPMLALQGDVLTPIANPGLCAPTPRAATHALLSGSADNGEYAVEWLRVARMQGGLTAGWSQEPVAITEMRRLAPDAWLRINPTAVINAPDAPPWQALFTQPPAQAAPLKAIGAQAVRSFATSPALADTVRKHSYNRLQPEVIVPRLPARLWEDFASEGAVGRHEVRVMWVDESDPPDWIAELLNVGGLQWFVIENERRHYDGPIATYKRPSDERGWEALFREIAPHALIRPAKDAVWMDCQLLLRGAAAGAALFADPRLHWPESLPVTRVASRYEDWRRAVERIRNEAEALAESGRQARREMQKLGWLEDEDVMHLLTPPAASGSANRAG